MTATVLVEQRDTEQDLIADRIAGSFIGTAAADALGWVTEFVRGRQHLQDLYGLDTVTNYRPWHKTSGGRFFGYRDDIGPGEYSDDTQLTLAIARSLEGDGELDVEHFAKRELPLWLDYSRGAGSTITHAARCLSRRTTAWNRNFFSYTHRREKLLSWESGANGAAMRVGPIALSNLRDRNRMVRGVWHSAIVTHGHPRAILGALIYAEVIRRVALDHQGTALRTVVEGVQNDVAGWSVPDTAPLADWLRARPDGTSSFMSLWERTKAEAQDGLRLVLTTEPGYGKQTMEQLGCFSPATRGSGLGTVFAGILLALYSPDDLGRAVTAAINLLGSDTDTIGGFVGGILGARLGYRAIPIAWAHQLQDYEYLTRVSIEVARLVAGEGLGGKAVLPAPHIVEKDPPDLIRLLHSKQIDQGQAVYHELFGYGTVRSVESQPVRRQGFRAYFAWVDFDLGQSCKFRYIKLA